MQVKGAPATRINEFSNDHLIVSLGKLFCSVCRETLAVKKSTILKRVKSSKLAYKLYEKNLLQNLSFFSCKTCSY